MILINLGIRTCTNIPDYEFYGIYIIEKEKYNHEHSEINSIEIVKSNNF